MYFDEKTFEPTLAQYFWTNISSVFILSYLVNIH